jgi:hypothetical protein
MAAVASFGIYKGQTALSAVQCQYLMFVLNVFFVKILWSRTLRRIEALEQHTFLNVNNYLNTNFYSYLETSGGQSSTLYLHVVHFFNTSVN